jgi:hypothetical protein
MLQSQIRGANDSWAIRWHASTFLADKLTLYPGRSLVDNIGNDSSGTHCGSTANYDAILSGSPINLMSLEVKQSEEGFIAFEHFFRHAKTNVLLKIARLLKGALKKTFL